MGAATDAVVGEAGGDGEKEQKGGDAKGEEKGEELHGDGDGKQQEGKGGGGQEEVGVVVDSSVATEARVSRLQTHHPVAPIQVAPTGHAAQARSFQPPTPSPLQATPLQVCG